MTSIYQSETWKSIQRDVYHKPSFEINLFGKTYFGTIKEKKLGNFVLKWYQILGLELPEDYSQLREIVKYIKATYGGSWKNIFFQFGITTSFSSFSVSEINESFSQEVRKQRLALHQQLMHLGLFHSFRENLPEAEITYDLTKTDEELMHDMNKSSAHRVRRGMKHNIVVRELQVSEYELFWEKWQKTADKKGFHTIRKDQYLHLVKYLIEEQKGSVLVSEEGGEIMAGSIMFFAGETLVCLYGFSDRAFAASGGQQYLKFKTFQWAREHGFTVCDIMGGAPTGFPEHPLASVSAFKESMGGIKSECIGNFDIVLNPWLYKLFKKAFSLKKRK